MREMVPISSLRDYNKVLNNISRDNPVVLTKNGRGTLAVVDLAEYDGLKKLEASMKLVHELHKGGQSDAWIDDKDLEAFFDRED